jgi:AcrR family transcriptional regulator
VVTKPSRTAKGEHTRQHILDTAISLFNERGYEETTMRDIAEAAECSLGLAYRYFARKEDMVLALYGELAAQSEAQAEMLPPGTIAERFYHTMIHKLEQVTPYRETLGALFGAAMNPKSDIAVLGDNTATIRKRMTNVFQIASAGATDAPKEPQASQMARLLFSVHLLILLFWLYDRTPGQRATDDLVKFVRDTMMLARPFLVLPPAARSLERLAAIVGSVFGGEA